MELSFFLAQLMGLSLAIFAVVGMTDSVRNWYKKNIPNYIEIYIKADLKKLLKLKRKKYIIKKIQET